VLIEHQGVGTTNNNKIDISQRTTATSAAEERTAVVGVA
jgi:hypothetical protein